MSNAPRDGFTLIEVMMTVLVIGILAAMAVPLMNPGITGALESVAQIVAADMARGRSLAVTNNSSYRFTFDASSNSYYLEHAGANSALDSLPTNPFGRNSDAASRNTTRLADLPVAATKLLKTVGASGAARTTLTFSPLGATTASDVTLIWLTAGASARQRYVAVTVNPVTGLATVGKLQTTAP